MKDLTPEMVLGKIEEKSNYFSNKKDIVNDLEIRVFGLRRSGNHAIINWFANQAPKPVHFFRSVPIDGGDIFLTSRKTGAENSISLNKIYYPHPSYKNALTIIIEKAREIKKKTLIYSYEDFDLRRFNSNHSRYFSELPKNREMIIGKSKKQIDVLILRDFFNHSASRLFLHGNNAKDPRHKLTHERYDKNRNNKKRLPFFEYYDGWEKDSEDIDGLIYINFEKYCQLWKTYAQEFLGITNYLENKICINFNQWFLSEEYRKTISGKFGFEFDDTLKNIISTVGSGSSFDKFNFIENANEMKVLERWKIFRGNKLVEKIYEINDYIIELNKKIFNIEYV